MSIPDTPHESSTASHAHDEVLPEEPKTPLWLTALGVALLVSGAVGYLLVHEPAVEEEEAAADTTAEKAEEPAKEDEAAKPPPRRLPKRFPPAARGSGARPRPPVPDLRNLLPGKRPGGER